MKKTRKVYYFDYSPEGYNYIMSSKLLRQSEKNILNDIINGKTVKELAMNYKCSEMTICRKRKKIFELTQALM
jgi:FixJ family two-component response regulator